MVNFKPLLFPLFDYLRRQGVPLGVSEYVLVVKTIREGVGLEDVSRLERLCRLVWAKSKEDQELFDVAFAKLVKPRLQTTLELNTQLDSDVGEKGGKAGKSNRSEEDKDGEAGKSTHSEQRETEEVKKPQTIPEPRLREYTEKPLLQNQEQPFLSAALQSPEEKPKPTDKEIKYHLTTRLPISRREMVAVWRQLRRFRREGLPEDFDVEGTIQNICQTGFFNRPVLQPRRRNQAKLVLLIDQYGSMAPFAPLIESFKESIEKGGLLGKTSIYYFHDCPEDFLYKHPNLAVATSLETVLSDQAKGNSVLIVSDAGAARGYYDSVRLEDTKNFLKALNENTYLYAWLNPMPATRWLATTAEDIACLVPMFPLNREGLNDAVSILRGHPFPPGVGLNE